MKRSTALTRALPALVLATGLALTGCSGGESSETGSAPEDAASQPAEETQEAVQLDEATLKQIVESTEVDGKTFTSVDVSQATGNEATKALEDAEFDPAECKDLTMAAFNAAKASEGTTVAGISSDNMISIGLSSFPDVDAASTQLSTSGKIAETCGDVKLKMQGVEMTMKSEPADATVAGADETIATRSSIDAGGQSTFAMETVYARVGNTVVSAVDMTGDADSAVKTAEAALEAVKNAG